MNGRNDEREIEDDGFYTCDVGRSSIVTNYINPPIPIRLYDWTATRQDYEPGDAVGYGATEQEAIDDLLGQLTN